MRALLAAGRDDDVAVADNDEGVDDDDEAVSAFADCIVLTDCVVTIVVTVERGVVGASTTPVVVDVNVDV